MKKPAPKKKRQARASGLHPRDHGTTRERDIAKGFEHVKDVASNIGHNVSDAASYVRHKADDAAATVGGALEDTGHYLREDGVHNIATDLTNVIRRNPVSSLLAGMAVGFLIAQATQRRGSSYSRNGEIDG